MGGRTSAAENRALAKALLAYLNQKIYEETRILTQFLDQYPRSAWRASLLINLGLVHQLSGATSKALAAWEEAWKLARDETDLKAHALADRAIGELVDLIARLGQDQRLESLLAELKGRDVVGSATEKVASARETLWLMHDTPETTLRCGLFALGRVRAALQPQQVWDPRIVEARATPLGTSLAQLNRLANQIEMKYQMARRLPGARMVLPAVMHWKQGHYAALLKEQNGRYLIQDPTLPRALGGELWASPDVLDSEGSGYYLVPDGPLPDGWIAVSETEGAAIWGRGPTTQNDNDKTGENQHKVPRYSWQDPNRLIELPGRREKVRDPRNQCDSTRGMAQYGVHTMLVSLSIVDTPVTYAPPRGTAINFRVTYSQREANQPAVFSYSNLGPKWTFDQLSYITDDPGNPNANVSLYRRGGGTERYSRFNPATQSFARNVESETVVVRTSSSPIRYERRFPDGSKEVFGEPSGTTAPRKVFMTQIVDPSQNTVNLSYDANLRLAAITDALNQVTTLSYDDTSDSPLLIRQVTDPFGRFARFEYDENRRLMRITDPIGIFSQFAYRGTGDFIDALTTPYGTTRFDFSEGPGNTRWLSATDPQGATERVQFLHSAPGISSSEAAVPAGVTVANDYLQYRNTFYWDKKAWADFGGDPPNYTKARIFHWLHQDDAFTTSSILESEKNPLESRVWYNYPEQPVVIWFGGSTHARPSKIARLLDDAETQLYQFEYNSAGKVTRATDPVGRVFAFTYAADDIDLLEVRQRRGPNNELLARFTHNNPDVPEQRCAPTTQRNTHLVCSSTDPAGQTTRYSYNQYGQLLTITNPRNETTTLTYDVGDRGYLMLVTGPVAGSTTRFTYDNFGRVQSLMDSDEYTLVFEYDPLDRPTRVIYPDGTFEETRYNRLDPEQFIDRSGRVTRRSYNALRQLEQIQDALTPPSVTRFEWCNCGALQRIVDPLGRETVWNYDVQGRVVNKRFDDGSQTRYTYEDSTSRVAEIIDAKGQKTEFSYLIDNNLRQIVRLDTGQVVTPPVLFSYDPNYNRVVTMQDGTGTTTYSYYPIASTPALGAGQLASVTGPLPNSAITYQYDELGRVARDAVNGVAVTLGYDELGRVTTESNPLGDFNYHYVTTTTRLESIEYPNGQNTTFRYYDNPGDRRLREIKNVTATTSVLSQFTYEYRVVGAVASWTKQRDKQPAIVYNFQYDAIDQLQRATSTSAGASQYDYDYDPAGNRTRETIDDAVMSADYNNLNQLVSRQVGTLADPDPVIRGSEMEYDGLGRRVRIVERENGMVTSEKRFLWCGTEICEERDSTGAIVTKRFHTQGVQLDGTSYYYTRDHLGNVREMTDPSGAIRARYEYDPYGRRTKISGDLDADFGFTGHYFHAPSGLHLALFRAYDANLGRWISRDPIAEAGGLNFYAYVANNPNNYVDPDGRWAFWAALPTFVAGSAALTLVAIAAAAVAVGVIIVQIGEAQIAKEEIADHLARLEQLYKLRDELCNACDPNSYPDSCARIADEIQWRQLKAFGRVRDLAEDVYKATNKPALGAR